MVGAGVPLAAPKLTVTVLPRPVPPVRAGCVVKAGAIGAVEAIVPVILPDTLCPTAFVPDSVKVNGPEPVGVPVTIPVAGANVAHAGRFVTVIDFPA